MVLLGTLYPLIGDALGVGRISVGPPYFGFMFVLLMLPAICLIPLGPFFRWAMADWRATLRALRPALIVAMIAAIAAKLTDARSCRCAASPALRRRCGSASASFFMQ